MIKRLKSLLFENRGLRQTITKNVFWLSISQFGSRLIRAIIIIYAARALGAAEYGIFSYLLGLAGFFTIFGDIGINQIITREMAKKPERQSDYFSTAFWIKIFLFLTTAALIVFIAPYFSKIEKANQLIYIVALIMIFDGLREFCFTLFRAKEKMELEALIMVLTNVAITIFGFVALYFYIDSQSLALSYAVATAIGALIAIVILKSEFKIVINKFDKSLITPIVFSAWPILLTGIIGALMFNTDIIMLGWWKTAEEIGLYSAGQKIVLLLYALPAILASAFFPTLSRLIGQGENNKIKQLMEKSVSAAFFIGIPLTIGGIVLARPITELVYGVEYLPSVPIFQILIATLFVVFPSTLIANSLVAYNQQKKLGLYTAIGAGANIVLNAALIPFYGAIGAAIATFISQYANNIPAWRLIKKINNFYIFRHLKKIIAGAIIMGIFSFIFNKSGMNVIINIIISAGIYFGVLYLFKEKIIDEIKIILAKVTGK